MFVQCISNAIKIKCTVSDALPAFMFSNTNFPEAVIASSFNTQIGLCFGVELYVTKGGKGIQNEAGITSRGAIILHIIKCCPEKPHIFPLNLPLRYTVLLDKKSPKTG